MQKVEFINTTIIFKDCWDKKEVKKYAQKLDVEGMLYKYRIYYKNKTCKEIGYSQKVKDNPFKVAYTKARKTQHARIRYNSHIEDYKNKHYEPWKKAAEQAKSNFEEKNDIAGFEKWLKDNKDAF